MKNELNAAGLGIAGILTGLLVGVGIGTVLMTPGTPDLPPASAVALAAPHGGAAPESTTADADKGQTVFATNCAACHGPEGHGVIGLAPDIRNPDFLALASDTFLTQTITTGRLGTAMVARPDLADQLPDLIAYIRKDHPNATAHAHTIPSLVGDPKAGAHTFGAYCASCHGPNGEGYSAGGVGPGIGLASFLEAADDNFIMHTLAHGRIGTPMRSFFGSEGLANLTHQDGYDVIAFLRGKLAVAQAAPKSVAPPTAVAIKGIAKKGKKLFAANCAACHQADGQGIPGLAPSIRNHDFLAVASDHFIAETITKGRPGTAMIPRTDLAGEGVAHITAWLRDVPNSPEPGALVDPERIFDGDVHAGAEKFSLYCAYCHGANGEGYAAGGSGPGIGLPHFLSAASDDFIFQTVKNGRVGTPMRGFIGAEGLANLDEKDVGDIIKYLRNR